MVKAAGLTVVETEKPYLLLEDTILFLGEIPRSTDFETGWPLPHCQQDGKEVWDAIEDDTFYCHESEKQRVDYPFRLCAFRNH
jgi:hypothetical protein